MILHNIYIYIYTYMCTYIYICTHTHTDEEDSCSLVLLTALNTVRLSCVLPNALCERVVDGVISRVIFEIWVCRLDLLALVSGWATSLGQARAEPPHDPPPSDCSPAWSRLSLTCAADCIERRCEYPIPPGCCFSRRFSQSSSIKSNLVHMLKQIVVTAVVVTVCWSYEV